MCSTYDFVCMLQDINWVSVIHVMFCVGWTWHGKGSGAVPWRKIRGLCMIMPRNSSACCSFHTIIVHHIAYISPSYPHYVGWMNQHLCRMNHVFCKPSFAVWISLISRCSNTILGLKSLGSIHFKNLTRLKQTLISTWCSHSKSSGKNI